ncbi:hypothetical protein C8Q77DRAFT_1134735 [Trametes polyzona]|nr:hypothetical protein C8Q77DRAFT_1134735 [Trametes polyzona]
MCYIVICQSPPQRPLVSLFESRITMQYSIFVSPLPPSQDPRPIGPLSNILGGRALVDRANHLRLRRKSMAVACASRNSPRETSYSAVPPEQGQFLEL